MPRRRDARIWLAALAAPLLVGCSGTGDGGTGDAPAEIEPNEYGSGQRVAEVVGPATWLDDADTASDSCSSPANRGVHVSGATVVAIDRFDETGDGARGNFYVQDTRQTPTPYGGVTVFDPSFSPPDLRLQENDVADISGILSEFLGPVSGKFGFCRTLPEIGGTMTFRFDGQGLPPTTIPLADLKAYETARPWLGMLVRVEGLTLAKAATNSSGRYTAEIDVGGGIQQADVPKLSNDLFDLEAEGPPLGEGTSFKAVTGIVTYFYGFKLAPRMAADFEL